MKNTTVSLSALALLSQPKPTVVRLFATVKQEGLVLSFLDGDKREAAPATNVAELRAAFRSLTADLPTGTEVEMLCSSSVDFPQDSTDRTDVRRLASRFRRTRLV